ncbi:MAG: SH3 domain-containing protein [Proteobacteria bacterium]|nr:SH3 domain-containing protein [Pseudomonadota bacterium]
MTLKTAALATAVFIASAGIASAATVTNDLNLRSGPGTGYRVVDTMPAGAYVDVIGCGGSWCRVNWRGSVGYASASYLAGGGGAYAAAPVYVAPPPVVSFGFGFGGPRWDHHRWHGHRGGWHHRRHH